ncbi:MAG: tRNA 2-thiouridine(34) synthase MnmA [bacterium]
MKEERRKNRVVVAMSGGIDSSVAAALLKKQGFSLIGAFMKFWASPERGGQGEGWNRCCSLESEKRARLVAKTLDIPFYVFNFEKEFKKRIVDYFLKEHGLGLTPNPCVVCNKEIKFGLLLEKALKLDADFIATGHYARIIEDRPRQLIRQIDPRPNPKLARKTSDSIRLCQGKDKGKDQSYFLWQLDQKQLNHILFPVGDYTKTQVRKLAKKFKLPVLNIPESQEICFIQTSVGDFLSRHIKLRPGLVVDVKGKTLGHHQGLSFYTIGQRKGIKLAGGPYYVLEKKLKKNILVVTKNEKDLFRKEIMVKNVNWISGKEPKFPLKVKAKIRYRHKAEFAKIYKIQNTKYKILFTKPQRAVTPGQSVVFYRKEELLGGGIIC